MASVAESTVEARLYEQHSQVVYRYCLRMLGSREDAEDAAQTTFFQAVRAMRRGVVPTFEQAWLLTIAKNECRSRHRANGRRRHVELAHDPQVLAEVAEAPNGADGTLIGVQQALARLPETQRRALLLREWQGQSYAEIAAELGVTRPAVEALLFRARRGLARELGAETTSKRHAFDLASLLAAVKSALGGGAAVKIAAGVVAIATVGSVAGGAEQRPTRAPAQAPTVRVHPAVAQAPEATASGSGQAQPRSGGAVDRPGASKRAQAPNGGPGNRPGVRRGEETGSPSASTPASGSPATKPGHPAAPEHAAAGPIASPSLPALPPAPSAPQAPGLSDLPGVPELPKVEVPKVEVPKVEVPKVDVPQLPQVPELPDLPQAPPLPDVPDLPAVPDLPVLP